MPAKRKTRSYSRDNRLYRYLKFQLIFGYELIVIIYTSFFLNKVHFLHNKLLTSLNFFSNQKNQAKQINFPFDFFTDRTPLPSQIFDAHLSEKT